MKKILISAFTPFNKANNNYSKEVLDYIESNEFDIQKVVIDVVYDESFKEYIKCRYQLGYKTDIVDNFGVNEEDSFIE